MSLVVLLVLLLIYTLLQTPRLLVHPLTITDDSDATEALQRQAISVIEEKLFADAPVLPGETQYLFRSAALERRVLNKLPALKQVELTPKWFGEWQLKLVQRIPFGTKCNEERCLLIDSEGVAVQEVVSGGIGVVLQSDDQLERGAHVFGQVEHSTQEVSRKNFAKLKKIIEKLEEMDAFVAYVGVRAGSYDVYLSLTNGIGVWVDTTETVHDITKALHVVFLEVFNDEARQKELHSIVICDPHGILWTTDVPWKRGCRDADHGTTEQ